MTATQLDVPEPVRSLDELFALAHALETEAAARYGEIASRMHALGLPEVAAIFETLAMEERQHVTAVEQWAESETGAGPDAARLRWRPPNAFDEDAARTIASSRLASAYRVFSLAVRNEERAFLLWTHIAAQAADAEIRKAAESMAMEELRHAALLRRERRHAFHAARAVAPPAASAAPVTARAIELRLAAELARLAEGQPAWAPDLRRLAAEAAAMAGEAGAIGGPAMPGPPAEPGLTGLQRLAERAAELYLDAAETAREEQALLRLQSLAARAIARIDRLGTLAGEG